MFYRFKITLMSIITCIIFSSYCFADDTSLGRKPEGVYPINNNDIEMVDELVNVNIKESKVECSFTFRNTGEDTKVLMGFPATYSKDYTQHVPGDHENSIISHFTAYDGKTELAVQLENEVEVNTEDSNNNKYGKWYTFEVDFKAGETKVIRNTYQFKAPITAVGPGLVLTGYILDTGAAWKGNIGHAKVIFNFEDILFTRIESVYPYDIEALTLKKDKLIFEKSDFEPNFNLEINYWVDPGILEVNEPFIAHLNYIRSMWEKRYYELIKVENADNSFRRAVIEGNSIEALYLYNFISKDKYKLSPPEIGEISINNDRTLNLSVIDFTGDLKYVKYQICSIENHNNIYYEREYTKDNIYSTFGIKDRIFKTKSEGYDSYKLKIFAEDYKNNTLNFETDVYLNGDSSIQNYEKVEDNESDLVEEKPNKEENNEYSKFILYFLTGILFVICIYQQIRLHKLKSR